MRLLPVVLLFLNILTLPAFAESSAMLTSVEGSNDGATVPSTKVVSNAALSLSSRATIVDHETGHGSGSVSVSDLSMVLGPAFNTMSTNPPSSSHPYSGIGTRHLLRLGYAVTDGVSVAPTLDVNQNFYDSRQGRLIFNDPSVRIAVSDVTRESFGQMRLNGSVWTSVYAPMSQVSKELHQSFSFSTAYVPRLYFRGSRFFLSGIAQWKMNVVENASRTGNLYPSQWLVAGQTNFRASRTISYFLMDHVNGNVGPNTVLVSTNLSSENYRKKMVASQTVFDCLMMGVNFELSPDIELSPRLDWLVNLPVGSTTIGLNASFHVI